MIKLNGDQIELEHLKRRSDRAVTEFLRAEIALGLTFVHTAAMDADWDLAGFAAAKKRAQEAVAAVRRFVGRIPDAQIRSEISALADQLEKKIHSLGEPLRKKSA